MVFTNTERYRVVDAIQVVQSSVSFTPRGSSVSALHPKNQPHRHPPYSTHANKSSASRSGGTALVEELDTETLSHPRPRGVQEIN